MRSSAARLRIQPGLRHAVLAFAPLTATSSSACHLFALDRSVAINGRYWNAFDAHTLRAIDAQPARHAVDLEAQLAFHPDLRDSKGIDSERVQPRSLQRRR